MISSFTLTNFNQGCPSRQVSNNRYAVVNSQKEGKTNEKNTIVLYDSHPIIIYMVYLKPDDYQF